MARMKTVPRSVPELEARVAALQAQIAETPDVMRRLLLIETRHRVERELRARRRLLAP